MKSSPGSNSCPTHILVTGANGFIGRHLCRHLDKMGMVVIPVSRGSGFDYAADLLPLEGVHHVFHLAGKTFVPDSWAEPAAFYEANALGTVRVLDQCRKQNVPVTFTSTYVYGRPASLPVHETAPARPNNPYAFSKLAGEDACRFFAETYGLRTTVLRLFNVYGPGQATEFLLPTIVRQICDPRNDVVEVADLAPRRDYVFIGDVVAALVATIGTDRASTFNVGSGASYSVEDVIQVAMSVAGIRKPFRSRGLERPNEIADVIADIASIQRELGWQPQVSLAGGLSQLIEEFR